MIKSLRFKRIKSYQDSGWIDLRPLTLLYGYNSAGKSTILQVLQMLKESALNPSREVPIVFSSNTGLDLGTYIDVSYNHVIDWKQPIEIFLKVDIEEMYYRLFRNGIVFNDEKINLPSKEICYSFSVGYNQKRRSNVILGFEIKDSEEKLVLSMSKATNANNAKEKYESDYYNVNKLGLSTTLMNFLPVVNVSDNLRHPLIIITNAIRNTIFNALNSMSNIGPVRAIPNRTMLFTGVRPLTVGRSGEEAFNLLYLNRVTQEQGERLLDKNVEEWLNQYNYKFKWSHLNGYLKEFRLIDNRTNLDVSIKDVGFGLSQTLPIVIQSFLADYNDMILIEQPEIHLHSRAQSELGEMFLHAINTQKSSKTKKRIIIETHSENILLRIRKMLALNKLNKLSTINFDDIAVYYINNKNGVSNIERIQLQDNGEIENQPEEFANFFSDDFNELMEMNIAIAKLKEQDR